MVYLYRFLCISGMQLQVHHTQLSHDQFTLYYTKSFFSWWRKLWLPALLHCCFCEAVVDTKERKRSRRSVATTINLLKDTVVVVVVVAVFNRDSKLCRRCHRKLVAKYWIKVDLAGRTKELRKQTERAGERAGVQL